MQLIITKVKENDQKMLFLAIPSSPTLISGVFFPVTGSVTNMGLPQRVTLKGFSRSLVKSFLDK